MSIFAVKVYYIIKFGNLIEWILGRRQDDGCKAFNRIFLRFGRFGK